MHLRINIPAWSAQELLHGAKSLAQGGYCDALRRELQAFAPEGWQCVLLASARYGLALAVEQLQVKRVAVPAYVCPAVLTGLTAAGAEAVAVDCAPSSFRYDAEKLAANVRAGLVEAVLAPNTYGLDQDFVGFKGLGVPVIEDAAYQAGLCSLVSGIWNLPDTRMPDAKYQIPDCGFRGNIGVWSFNFKALTGIGGGVLWIADCQLPTADRRLPTVSGSVLFANYAVRGILRHRLPRFAGGAAPPVAEGETMARAVLQEMRRGPMSELQAALALTQWRRRATLQARQQENSRRLSETLARATILTSVADTAQNVKAHLFPMLAQTPAAVYPVRKALYRQGIQTETPYPIVLGGREKFPHAHDLAARLILVPCHASLGAKQIAHIAGALERLKDETFD